MKYNYFHIQGIKYRYHYAIISILFLWGGFLLSTISWWNALKVHGIEVKPKLAVISQGLSIFAKYIPEKMLWWHAMGGIALTMATVLFSGYIAAVTVLSIGFFISIMFPVIFSLVLDGCRSDKSAVAGFLCMANIGGALLPLLQGMLADSYGLHRSFLLPICGFAYIACYSLYIRRRSLGAQDYELF